MNTPRRTIRIEDELWTAASDKANEEGTTVTEVIRNALAVYVKAGAAVVVAVLAVLTLGACGGSDSPAAERSAPAATTAPVAVDEPTAEPTAECWTGGYVWLDRYNNLTVNPVAAVAFLETLPSPSEGCTEADSAALQNAQDKILDTRERFPDLF